MNILFSMTLKEMGGQSKTRIREVLTDIQYYN